MDDGSTDESYEILSEYAERDKRFRIVQQKNAGVSVARNTGIDLSIGEYVTFLDADDAYASKWLEMAHRYLSDTPVDMLRFRCTTWRPEACSTPIVGGETEVSRTFEDNSAVLAWGKLALILEGWCWSLFLKRGVLHENPECRFPVGMRVWEDNIFCLSLLPFLHSACQGGYAGYLYRQRPGSACCRRICDVDIHRFLFELNRLSVIGDIASDELPMVIFRWMVVWRRYRGAVDRVCENGVVDLLRKLVRARLFILGSLPVKWRPAFIVLLKTGSFMLLDILAAVDRMRSHRGNGLFGSESANG